MRRRMRPFRTGFRGGRRGFQPGFRRRARRARSAFHPARRIVRRIGRRLLIGTGLAVLLFGEGAIKLEQEDLDRIEGYMGKAAETLTEAELFAAMEALNIQRLELTEKEAILVEKTARPHRLSGSCGRCGAPLRRDAGVGHGAQTGSCEYCGTLL